MSRASLSFQRPPALAIADGDVTPNPGSPGTWAWSTVLEALVVWDGAKWSLPKDPVENRDRNYVHTQPVPADTWVVQHNLGKYPAITVIDSAGDEVRGDIHHDSINQATLTFGYAFSGAASCN